MNETYGQKSTSSSKSGYEDIKTQGPDFEETYDKFLPRTEFQLYKESEERISSNLKWFIGIAISILAIFIAVAMFVIPNTLNRNDREAIYKFEQRLNQVDDKLEIIIEDIKRINKKLK